MNSEDNAVTTKHFAVKKIIAFRRAETADGPDRVARRYIAISFTSSDGRAGTYLLIGNKQIPELLSALQTYYDRNYGPGKVAE